MMIQKVLFTIFISLCAALTASAQELRLGASSVEPPYLYADQNGNIVGGITQELALTVAHSVGLPLKVSIFSRNRLESALRDGVIDMVCRMKQEWFKHPDDFDWSGPLIEQEDIIIGLKDAPVIKRWDDLRGAWVGTTTGYAYSPLTQAFRDKQIHRDDSATEEGLIRKLLAHRTKYIVIDAMVFNHYVQRTDTAQLFRTPAFSLEKHYTECAVWKKTPVGLKQMSSAFNQIREQKTMSKIEKKYR